MGNVRRLGSWLILLTAALAAAAGPPPLPKDTLPPNLALDTVPRGLDPRPATPAESPLTPTRAELGRRLFFDPILSADRTVACASCHDPAHGFAGAEPFSRGIGGARTTRNAPSLLNRAYGKAFFWDGRAATLEEQALQPIESKTEMGATVGEVLHRLRADADYSRRFAAAFPDGVTAPNLARALAAFERTLLHGDTRVDRFRTGDVAALRNDERHGLWLFESRGRCWRCHAGPNFTDEQFHNTGVGSDGPDPGRHAVTHQESDRGRFKTPTLRGLVATAPYMHDGSVKTLREVVEYYNRGGNKNAHLDPVLAPLELSAEEVDDLVAFLRALSEPAADTRTSARGR